MKKIVITGARSYIGEHICDYLRQYPECYQVAVMDVRGLTPKPEQFSDCDVVINVAGVTHVKETRENRQSFYEVNRDLAVQIAEAAKAAGVGQFILFSTMAVYGLLCGYITKDTIPKPRSAYGASKLQADEKIMGLADESFLFACLRSPMVYGENCKGNYQRLRKFALTSPLFPQCDNQRSMLFIGNLCAFVKDCIDEEKHGLFFPQNTEYSNVSDMVRLIADEHGKQIKMTGRMNRCIKKLPFNVFRKVFGDLTYEKVDLVSAFGFEESISLTENVQHLKSVRV